MFNALIRKTIKYLYRLSIFKIVLIDRFDLMIYNRLKTFFEYEFSSNFGPIKFVFKEDRRTRRHGINKILYLDSFLVELKIPDDIKVDRQDLKDKVMVVTMFVTKRVNYEILAEVLLDKYIKEMLSIAYVDC